MDRGLSRNLLGPIYRLSDLGVGDFDYYSREEFTIFGPMKSVETLNYVAPLKKGCIREKTNKN